MYNYNAKNMNKIIETLRYEQKEDYLQSNAHLTTYQTKKFVGVKTVKGDIVSWRY